MKDYYQILEIELWATQPEIKKAYRKLAQQYHPDKNFQDLHATARFSEIKEAYEVLTNPAKREYYLEERWLLKAMGKKGGETVFTPVSLLKQVLEFDRHLSRLDVHRMNKEGLYQYIYSELLKEDAVQKLNSFHEEQINREIISLILKNLYSMPAEHLENLEKRMLMIHSDQATIDNINSGFRSQQKHNEREKNRIWIILLIVIVISLLIFFAGE